MSDTGRLRAARELRGMSLRGMARETGFDAAYISRVERGLQRPSIDFLKAAASVLDLGEVSRTLAAVWP